MKKVLIIVAAVVAGGAVLAAVIVGSVFWVTGGAVDAGERFLALLAEDQIKEAYDSTAAGFRTQQSESAFAAAVREIGLTRYRSASWLNRQVQNNQATLEGSVTTSEGGTIPLTMTLVSEGDEWKVLGLTTPLAGAAINRAEGRPAAEALSAKPENSSAPPSMPVSEEAKNADKPPTAAVSDQGGPYAVAENSSLTGRLGRIVVTFPQGTNASSTRVQIRPAGGSEASGSGYGDTTIDLLPGQYDVEISNVVIPAVEVRSRSDSTIAVGVLRVSAGSSTRIQVFKGQAAVASGYGNTQFGLPAGAYEVEVSGKRESITIPPGGAVDF